MIKNKIYLLNSKFKIMLNNNNKFKLSDFIFDPSKDELGHGKFGHVYKVKYKNDNNIYALKIIQVNPNDKSQSKNIQNEFKVLLNTNHENIEKFYGYFNDYFPTVNEVCHFFILEFIDGETLQDILNRYKDLKKPISQELIIKMLTGIVKGLNYLHKNNILQRDLAPDNIMINKNNIIKITDFGMSAFYSDEFFLQKSIVGREKYASPEIFKAALLNQEKAYYNSKTDIFSLGVIMFYLMTFNYPNILSERNISNIKEYKDCIDENLYNINLINIVMRMLEIEQDKRPSCEEILYSLERIENNKNLNLDKASSFTCVILCLSNIDELYKYLIENERNPKKINDSSFFVVQQFCTMLKKAKEIKCLNNNFINKFIEDISKYINLFEEKNITLESIFKTFFDYFLYIFPKIFIFNNDKAKKLLEDNEDNKDNKNNKDNKDNKDNKENLFINQKLRTYEQLYNNKFSYIFNFLVLKKIYCPKCKKVLRQDIEIIYDIEFNEKGKKISDLLKQYEEIHDYLNNRKNKMSCNECGKMPKKLDEIKKIYSSPEVFIFHFGNGVELDEFVKIKVSSGKQSSEIYYNLQSIIFEKQNNNEIKYEIAIKKKENWIYYSSNESKFINVKDVLNIGNVCTAFYTVSSNEFSIFQSKI